MTKSKRLQWTLLALATVLSITIYSCRKDNDEECCDPTNPECPNYDPCYGISETTADFTIAGQLAPGGPNGDVFIEDSVFVGRDLKFSAVDPNADSYTWYIGIDTFYNETEVIRNINNLSNGTYGLSLVIEKEPNLDCYPTDTGRDSVYKEFTKIDNCDVLFNGSFNGSWQFNPNQVDTVSFVFSDDFYLSGCTSPAFLFGLNLNMNTDTTNISTYNYMNDRLLMYGNGDYEPDGEVYVNPATLEVTMNYQYQNTNYSFTGYKIE